MEIGGEKFINSDDILARIADLEAAAEVLSDNDLPLDAEDQSELDNLRDVASESGIDQNSTVFYREDYFTEAMEDDAYDFGFIQKDSPVAGHVDWDGYAESVQVDYSEYTIGGYTYYARG